jgi:hypothetical protein
MKLRDTMSRRLKKRWGSMTLNRQVTKICFRSYEMVSEVAPGNGASGLLTN